MGAMRNHTRLVPIALAAAAAIVAGACTSGSAGEDKAGGSGEPVVLRMANPYGGLETLPAVAHFVDRVEELSGRDLRVTVVDSYGGFASDAEQRVVRDVANGEVDLGWVGTRVLDTMGVESFQALTAPMLVDSYALEDAVIQSGITDQMLPALDDVGVVGLAVLADGLRKPIAVDGPVLGPADWRGTAFGTLQSDGQEQAIRTVGGTPAEVFGPNRLSALDNGTIQGFEFNLRSYGPKEVNLAPYVTANVDLWPQMDVLLVDAERFGRLTAEQQAWLRRAADEAADRSATLADTDARFLRNACDAGARFADASQADLAALRDAFAPVYADLEQDAQTKAFIERIQALKRSVVAGPGLVIPASCTGRAPGQPTSPKGTAPAYLNGTYRYVITLDEARQAGEVDPEDVYPQVTTVVLEDGHLQGGCFGSAGGTYSFEGDSITFHSVEYGYDLAVTFTRDDHGNLRLTPVPPMDLGDAFTCFSKVWTKIG